MSDKPVSYAQELVGSGLHPSVAQVLRHFASSHLPEPLQSVSAACGALAEKMAYTLPQGPELTVGLRKLLEAKDCFVRTLLEPIGPVREP